ncbi:MAG: membrane protein insertase YidC [Bacteroidaceae bacterium]|nr:membrane protein insertase YidC [Bacteroidaceae bacterium]
MNKNTIIGYLLIGAVLLGYFYFNQPNPEQLAAQRRYQDSIAQVQYAQEQAAIQAAEERQVTLATQSTDSTSMLFNVLKGEEKFITLKNEKLSVRISTLGGRVCSATLADYNNQEGEPITLFDEKDHITVRNARRGNEDLYNQFYFTLDGKEDNINTSELYFTPVEVTDSSVTMRLAFNTDRYMDFAYALIPDSYMLNLSVEAHNMQNILPGSSREIGINWDQLIRQQEKGFTFEQQYTNITYKLKDDDTENLSERSSDKENIDQPVDWVALKNQFFSCIVISADEFSDVSLSSDTLHEGRGYMKNCSVAMYAPFDPSGKHPTDLQFYFGPNKYSELKASNNLSINSDKELQLHKLIYFGWPIVRLINRYFIIYLFDWLTSWGLSMGLVLLLLTLIVKGIVYPFTYKSYLSSAKMRALKPYIDEVNAKYPKPEDAMKKQQEIMTLYSKYGASPMGGCLPMLIQMPVFIALFNFVPNAIELRQQSFLWAHDLSSYDALISWNTSIWPIGNHISIFCLLFCVTQLLNTYYMQKMQPSMGGSPEQEAQMKIMRWMMYIMPVMFFFIFNDYSSGLNYYYFLSTLISVLIYIYLRYTIKEDELLRKMQTYYEANKNNPSKRSGMMARLEALQQEQQRLLEEQQKRRKK